MVIRNRTIIGFLAIAMLAQPAIAHDGSAVVPKSTLEMALSFADVVEQSNPSVVNIYAKRLRKSSVPLFEDPFFSNFFKGFGLQTERQENSLGSGVVVDSSGLIISNLHVLQGAEDIVVVTHDRREYQAEIVLEDDKNDLAVIRLSNFKGILPSLPFGDVYKSRVGDLVLAIGNPFGVSQTVTSGIISGLARTQVNENRIQSFIQTDAAINPGNSGGALIDIQGHLLGINTAIISPTGSSTGLGFAIPVNMIKPIVYAAKNDIPLNRAWLGFEPQIVDTDSAEALGLLYPHGTLVGTVVKDSPADVAGLKSGDLVVAVEGNPIETPSNLRFFVATLIPEITPEITLTLHGEEENHTVSFPVQFPPAIPAMDRRVMGQNTILGGAAIMNISPFVIEHFALPFGSEGVLVAEAAVNANALRFGFQIGDIVRTLNNQPINDVEMLDGLVNGPRPKEWDIVVLRKGKLTRWKLVG